jgi:hypothetical protein
MESSEAIQVAFYITTLLDSLGIPYVVVGSMASIVHGQARTTLDVDILADIQQNQVDRFVAGLSDKFYVDELAIREAIKHRSSFNLIYLSSMFKVDIFLPKNRAFDQQQLNRKVRARIMPSSDESYWVLSAEDIILAKLDWFRLGSEVSERQWRDVLSILKAHDTGLDISYLRQWASALEVSDLLERALIEGRAI